MEATASTSGLSKKVAMCTKNLDVELHYLIAKYLSLGPCKKSYEALKEEIEGNKILPVRLDWEGNKHLKSFNEYDKENEHIARDFLFRLVSRLGPTIQQLYPSYPSNKETFLGSGSQSLLRTEKESSKEYRLLHNAIVRHRGNVVLEPINLKGPPNNVHSVIGRELSGSFNKTHFQTNKFYCRIHQFVRNVGHLSAIYCMLFDRRGRYIITGADDMLVKVWSIIDGRLVATLRGASAEISDLSIDHENTLVAAGSCDKIIRVWSLQTLAPVAVLIGHTGVVTALQFCPAPDSEGVLVSTGGDGCVAFWTYSRRKTEIKFDPKPLKLNERVRPGHAQLICASFSSGGNFLAIGGADHFVRVYRLGGPEGVEKLVEIEHHSDRVDSIQWCHSGIGFVSGSRDGVALIWRYQRQQWKTTALKMTDVLPGFILSEEDLKRLQVTMVGWDRTDTLVITASSDHLIRVWDSRTGTLKHILKGHEDNAYVIEAHPTNTRLILTAGHDGQLFIWDVIAGIGVKNFKNTIEGQGHGALFDAKWAPDGISIAATDSHGHILMFGIGDNERFKNIPQELFFHTDYRPLVRDVNHHVLDEQTQLAPHVMPPPFLVNIDGDPYPPDFQRLVHGRENCRDDQLIPNVILNDNGEQEVMDLAAHEIVEHPDFQFPGPSVTGPSEAEPSEAGPSEAGPSEAGPPEAGSSEAGHGNRPSIDDMIQRLEQERRSVTRPQDVASGSSGEALRSERRLSSNHPDHSYAANSGHDPMSPRAGHVGSRREGDIEGIRQSTGNWQRDPNMKWKRQVFVPALSPNVLSQSVSLRKATGENEIRSYEVEANKKPEVLASKVITQSFERDGRKNKRRQKKKSHAYSTRGAREISSVANNENQLAEPSSPSRSTTSRTQATFGEDFEDPDNVISNEENSSSTSSPSSEVEKDVLEEESESSSSDNNSTDYSDWTADVGVGLEPPKRTVHKQKTHPSKSRKKRKKKIRKEEAETEDEDEEQKLVAKTSRVRRRRSDGRSAAKDETISALPTRSRRGKRQLNLAESEGEGGDIDEIPPEFRPPEWLSETVPKKAPYFPQMGDEVIYFCQGHQLYVEAVINRKLYQVDKRTLPWLRKNNLRDQEYVKIIGMKFEIKPPRLCCLKLGKLNGDGTLTSDSFAIKYHDLPDVLDFLVLKKTYDAALARNWQRNDRFRCIIDDAWWLGTVESQEPHLQEFLDSVFMCYRVLWDNGERERLSPWDMEPIDKKMELPEVGGCLRVTPAEYKRLVYSPSLEEWGVPSSFKDESRRMADGIGKIIELAIAEPFLAPVDLNVYPNYAMIVEYPIDLSTIKSRIESHFYRRPNAVQFDVRYIATNAEKFNKKGSVIVKNARIVTDLALRLIKDKLCHDPTVFYHEIQANYQSPMHSEDESNKKTRSGRNSDSGGENPRSRMNARGASKRGVLRDGSITLPKIDERPWQVQCRDLLKSMFERQDSEPFRYPVDLDRYNDYNQVIDVAMDLTTIREELATGAYQVPVEFAKDVRLVFANSKTYNTNNKSRIYSMTVRLEAFFEDQIKAIFNSWRCKGKTRKVRGRGRPQKVAASQPRRQIKPLSPVVSDASTRATTPTSVGFKKEADKASGAGPSSMMNNGLNDGNEKGASSNEDFRGSIREGGKRRSRRVAKLRKLCDNTDDSDEEYSPNQRATRTTPLKIGHSRPLLTPTKSSTLRGSSRTSSPIDKGKGGPIKRSSFKRYEYDSDFEAPHPSRRTSSSSSSKLKKSRRYEDDSDFEANVSPTSPHVSVDSGSEKNIKVDKKKRAKVGAPNFRRKALNSDSSQEEDDRDLDNTRKSGGGPKRVIESSSSEREDEPCKKDETHSLNGLTKSSEEESEEEKEKTEEEIEKEIEKSDGSGEESEKSEEENTDDEEGSSSKSDISINVKKKSVVKPVTVAPFPRRKKLDESEVEFDDEELEEDDSEEEEEKEKQKKKGGHIKSVCAMVRRARRKKLGNESCDDDEDEDYVNDFIDDDDASAVSSEASSSTEFDDSDEDKHLRRKKKKKMTTQEKRKLKKEKEMDRRAQAKARFQALKAKEKAKREKEKAKAKAKEKNKEKQQKQKALMKQTQGKHNFKGKANNVAKKRSNNMTMLNGTANPSHFPTQGNTDYMLMYPSSSTVVPLAPVPYNPQTHTVKEVRVGGKVIGRKITAIVPDIMNLLETDVPMVPNEAYLANPIIGDTYNTPYVTPSEMPSNCNKRLFDESDEDVVGHRGRRRKKVHYNENDSDEEGLSTVSSRGRVRKANTRMRDFI